jgi:hypothetical protein
MNIKSDKRFFELWRLAKVEDLKRDLEYIVIFKDNFSSQELLKKSHYVHKIHRFGGQSNDSWNYYRKVLVRWTKQEKIYIRKTI